MNIRRKDYDKLHHWDIPSQEYYEELCRISKHQIIWGINYFDFKEVPSGRIVWDKVNQTSSFSDAEIASCSLIKSTRLFRYMWNGMCQGKSILEGHIMQGNKSLNEQRIHPTQKPVALYAWLLNQFAKERWKILDTHVGSGSSRIAAYEYGFDYIGFEKDKSMWEKQEKRLRNIKSVTQICLKMRTYKIIIAGCRDYCKEQPIDGKVMECLRNGEFGDTLPLEIVSGGASGVDAVGEIIAHRYKLKLTVFPAKWEQFGKSAGPIRNAEMADYADCLLAF